MFVLVVTSFCPYPEPPILLNQLYQLAHLHGARVISLVPAVNIPPRPTLELSRELAMKPAFKLKGKGLLEKHAIAPSAASACWMAARGETKTVQLMPSIKSKLDVAADVYAMPWSIDGRCLTVRAVADKEFYPS
jgi:hypothetical protein